MGMTRSDPQFLMDNSGTGIGYEDKGGNQRQLVEAAVNPLTGGVELDAGGKSMVFPLNNFAAALKWFGGNINGETSGTPNAEASSSASTHGFLWTAEAPFYAVQIVAVNVVDNALSGLTALVGVTETADTTISANLSKPVIGGTTYGQLAPAGSVNGFRSVTWGGAASPSIDASVAYSSPSSPGSLKIAVSDIIPLSSIPRVDDPTGLPALVARVYQNGTTGGKWGFQSAPAAMRKKTASNRGRLLQAMWSGSDAVANPALNTSLATDAKLVFPIFHYAVPAMTVLVAGDSISQNDAIVSDVYTSWGWRGVADASTQSRPINYINCGCSSKNSAEYWARAQDIVNAGIVPDVLVIGPASVNDAYITNTDRVLSDCRARAVEIMRFAKSKGIKRVCWIPLLPYNSTNSTTDAARLAFNTWLATIPGTDVLNFSELGNGASPERWVSAYNQSADGVHPNETAIDTIMAPKLTAYLNRLQII